MNVVSGHVHLAYKMLRCIAAALLLVCATVSAQAGSPPGDVVGKVTVGYQGWFAAPGDGSPVNNWDHTNLEMWPDVREYSQTYQTTLANLGNGQPAKMFSSYDQSTVNTHFTWMAQNGIDCAALQRFGNEITPGSAIRAQRDGMAVRVMNGAKVLHHVRHVGGHLIPSIRLDEYHRQHATPDLLTRLRQAEWQTGGLPVGLRYTWFAPTPAQGLNLVNWFKAMLLMFWRLRGAPATAFPARTTVWCMMRST